MSFQKDQIPFNYNRTPIKNPKKESKSPFSQFLEQLPAQSPILTNPFQITNQRQSFVPPILPSLIKMQTPRSSCFKENDAPDLFQEDEQFSHIHKKLIFDNPLHSPPRTAHKTNVMLTPTLKNTSLHLCKTPSLSLKMPSKQENFSNKRKNSYMLSDLKVIACNCKKSQCQKLYCDCYANGRECGKECNCRDCHNLLSVQKNTVKKTVQPKIETMQILKQHFKGCNCKKSSCQKNYCECFLAGVPCSELCHCLQCKNQ